MQFPRCRSLAGNAAVLQAASMVACQNFAWGPAQGGSIGLRGYRERHVFRVAGCPGYQFMRSLRWSPRPMQLQAISEETEQKFPDEFRFSGPCVDCLQTDGGDPIRPETLSVHAGEREGRPRVADSLTTPIVQTSTYSFRDTEELIAYQEGRYGSYEYGRYGNPTTRTLEEKIRVLEGAEDCLVSSSGMNSATTMLLALVPAGGHIVTTTDCYRRTRQFIQTVLPKMGITATVIDPADLGALERCLEQHKVSLFFSESPTNPYLRCVDVRRISQLCRAKGALVCIDSTFATPINQRAIEHGADVVIHSATKYLGGHNDVLAGALAGKAETVAAVRSMHNVLGGTVDPFAAFLLLRGMKTLGIRVNQHNRSALEIAKRLEAHPRILRVHYPGLPSHPDHAIACQQMQGFGGVVSFEVDGGLWETAAFIDAVKLPYIAPSLGAVESLIEQPTVISYWDQGPEKRAEYNIKDNLVRFSVGVEDVEDIWNDLEQALAKALGPSPKHTVSTLNGNGGAVAVGAL